MFLGVKPLFLYLLTSFSYFLAASTSMLSPLYDPCCGQKHAFQTVSTLEGRNAARNVADRKAGRRVPPPSDAAKDASISSYLLHSSIAHAHDLNHFLHNEGLFLRYVGFASCSLSSSGSLRLMDLHATQKKHLLCIKVMARHHF